MPFSNPDSTHNPSTSTVIPATWGDVVNANQNYMATNKPHARVFNSTTQSITSATPTAVTFDSERFDVGGCHSTASNTSRLTAPTGEGGKYMIGGHVAWQVSAGGNYRQARLRVNGSTYIAYQTAQPSGTHASEVSVATLYQLAATDYVELVVVQDSGGALTTAASSAFTPEFWFCWMAT